MNKLLKWLGLSAVGIGAAAAVESRSPFDRAFEQREKYESSVYSEMSRFGYSHDSLFYIRRENSRKYAKEFPKLGNVVSVYLNKTSDGGDWVIQLRDVDGKTASLWLVGGAEEGSLAVRTITGY